MTNEGALKLERYRRKKKLKQKQLAALCGLDEPLISRLLRGVRRPNLEQALRIKRACSVDPALWFADVGSSKESAA